MSRLPRIFSKRWILSTLLVLVGVAVLARLGVWQLDRLEQRRTFNSRVLAQIDQPELRLAGEALKEDLANMEYREVVVQGEYDFAHQIAVRNQIWENQWGVHLVTPLRITGADIAVLVDRGWIPAEVYESGDWSKYDEPGAVTVTGVLRRSQTKADFGRRSDPTPIPGATPLKAWNFVNVASIGVQTPYPLLLVYIQQTPDPAWTTLPYRSQPEVEISEGPHLGYALQWFTFAAILGLGYPAFIHRQERKNSI